MKQHYAIKFEVHYRGITIEYEAVESDWEAAENEDYFAVELEHPTSGYKVYWGCEFPTFSVDKAWTFDKKEEAIQHMHKIYSQINDRLPFVVTGHNSAYKEKGYYPEISEEIQNMDEVELPYELKSDEHYYFMILMDTNAILQVLPLEFG